MKELYYVGLDVHKDSIQMAILGTKSKEPIKAKALPNDAIKIVKELAPYQEKGTVQVAYEAGCLGYTLQRTLGSFGFDCRVIPPNKVFHGSDVNIKTDKRDALDIAWMLRRDEGESIAIPSEEDEATRDLLRCRGDVQEDLKRAKQRLLKFLLRKGIQYETTAYWTQKHRNWLNSLKFEREYERLTFEEYLAEVEHLENRLKNLDEKIEEIAESERYTEKVRKFRAFKGIDYLTALSLVVEIGDFRRFPSAESLMSYLGLVVKEQTSGKKRHQGGITKTGNSHVRKLLIESSWHYTKGTQVGKLLAKRREGTDERTITYADKAMTRLYKKYMRLVSRGKVKQVAVTAVARELTGFIWGVMTMAA
jgi:transposase